MPGSKLRIKSSNQLCKDNICQPQLSTLLLTNSTTVQIKSHHRFYQTSSETRNIFHASVVPKQGSRSIASRIMDFSFFSSITPDGIQYIVFERCDTFTSTSYEEYIHLSQSSYPPLIAMENELLLM
mmetsp:Transcript_44887/g.48590  ORF Transcript_44887/g.48590 Transcript_44887/m.48590 type:complete len:126 (-) Transcript_44887:226-603(-)